MKIFSQTEKKKNLGENGTTETWIEGISVLNLADTARCRFLSSLCSKHTPLTLDRCTIFTTIFFHFNFSFSGSGTTWFDVVFIFIDHNSKMSVYLTGCKYTWFETVAQFLAIFEYIALIVCANYCIFLYIHHKSIVVILFDTLQPHLSESWSLHNNAYI